MGKQINIDFGTTPKSIIEHFAKADPNDSNYMMIPNYSFKELEQAIEDYANFQVGVEMAGEDI